MDAAEIGRVVVRIQSEFLEHPGLRLTGAEVEHLCAVPGEACEAVLAFLVEAGVLRRMPDGSVLMRSARTETPETDATAARLAAVEFHTFASLGVPADDDRAGARRPTRRFWIN